MEIHDPEFEKLVKKAQQKRLWLNSVLPILVVVVIALLGTSAYLAHYHLWIFTGDKVAGIADNHIQKVERNDGMMDLLYSSYGGYEFNGKLKSVKVYLDEYAKEKKVSRELIASIDSAKEGDMSGQVYWGGDRQSDGNFLPQEIRVAMRVGGGVTYRSVKLTKQASGLERTAVHNAFPQAFAEKKQSKIQRGTVYVLHMWHVSAKSILVWEASSFEEYRKKGLGGIDQTYCLAMVFE